MVTRIKEPSVAEKAPVAEQTQEQIRGRSAFNVELTPAGVVVNTVFVSEDETVRPLPAVFPNLEYALGQIDALRAMVINQFATAAELGMKSLQERPKGEGEDR